MIIAYYLSIFIFFFAFVWFASLSLSLCVITLTAGGELETGPWSKTRLRAPNLPDGQQVRSQRVETEV